jgi:ATP-binding cassette subfamily B protein
LFTGFRERRTTRMRIVALLPLAGRPLVALAVLVQVVAGLLPVGFILATAAVIAGVPETVAAGLDSPQWRHLQDLLVLAAASFFGTQLLLPLQEYLGELVRRRIDDRMRDRLLSASFAGGGVAVLEDSELRDEAADAANLLRVAMWTPGAACAGQLALVSRYLQTIAPAVVVSIAYAWSAGPALLAAALIIRFGYRLGLAAFGKVFRSTHQSRRRSWYFRDLLLGSVAAKEVRVFGLLPWVSQRYAEAALDGVRPVWQSRRRLFHGPYVLYTLAAFVLLGAVFTGAARASAAGLLGIGALMLVLQSGMSAMRIGGFIAESDVQTEYGMLAYRALERFEEITAAAARTGAGEGRDPAGLPVTELRFENVTFGYPGGEPVLDGLDLRIPAGRSLAVVGLNGAGKTTLVKLLARLYEPTGGRITADGVDIRSFPVSVWQRRIAAIFQDFVHFELSVRENVGFGAVELLDDPERGDKAVTAALDRVGATGFVRRLPGGLDTPLSRQYTGGTDLSGGQWQRIAIARALMAVEGGAGVLVLDEPTANLDVRAEVAFFDRFLALTRGVTSLVISHRFSTVRRADRIVVLEHGRVLEDGTHDELLALGGRYAELFRLQASRFEGSRA